MSENQKISVKNPWGELSADLKPSAFLQICIPLLIIGIIALYQNQPIITFIVICIISFGAFKAITTKKLRWTFYTGKLSREIMTDGTGGSRHKPITNFQEADIVEEKQLQSPIKKLSGTKRGNK